MLSAVAPVLVPGLADITQIATGPRHSLALTRDGHVWSWGANHSGELGLGTRLTGWTPAVVPGLDRIVAIAAGATSNNGVSGAVRDDGTVRMWGTNASGMIGNGQSNPAPDGPGGRVLVPAQVQGLTGARQLSIGAGHVAAVLGDGTVRMWGHNGYGQLGLGTTVPYEPRPVKVAALTNVAAVHLGSMRSYAITADGRFWVWGFGDSQTRGLLARHLHVPTLLELP